jgi:hypothetical protein
MDLAARATRDGRHPDADRRSRISVMTGALLAVYVR